MKIKYFGTAAAEGIPGLFCECRVCKNARKVGGKEIKTRSQSLIDDKILIDFPADTYMHALYNNLPLTKIHTCIVTHGHSDHLYPADLWCRCKGIGNEIEEKPLNIYAPEAAYNAISEEIKKHRLDVSERATATLVTPFVSFEAEGYTITPLKADHASAPTPVFYMIEKDGKALLYCHDTALFPQETFDFLQTCGKHFDLVSLDCTNMILEYGGTHMGLVQNTAVKNTLTDWGLCDNKTVFVINHFSHNGKLTHAELETEAAKYGFIVSYDGFEIEF